MTLNGMGITPHHAMPVRPRVSRPLHGVQDVTAGRFRETCAPRSEPPFPSKIGDRVSRRIAMKVQLLVAHWYDLRSSIKARYLGIGPTDDRRRPGCRSGPPR